MSFKISKGEDLREVREVELSKTREFQAKEQSRR